MKPRDLKWDEMLPLALSAAVVNLKIQLDAHAGERHERDVGGLVALVDGRRSGSTQKCRRAPSMTPSPSCSLLVSGWVRVRGQYGDLMCVSCVLWVGGMPCAVRGERACRVVCVVGVPLGGFAGRLVFHNVKVHTHAS